VSSFGAESAVLLAMAAEIDPAVPVVFLDTGKLFGETITYRDKLVRTLGLTNVQTFIAPIRGHEAEQDKPGTLWRDNPGRLLRLSQGRAAGARAEAVSPAGSPAASGFRAAAAPPCR
jgi:phosphoadenosine phosphosulfate reductase